ncbi:MAG TPA: hypothetical protein VLI04_01515 [Nocardioidaceae bacterium]|nr:hypothetical protein [Nocardioidaceae bacterium]
MLARALLATLSSCVACGIALTGCSGDEPSAEPSRTPSTITPTETPSPTVTESTPPETTPEVEQPTPPSFAKGAAGQEAFATYVVELWAYALAANNAVPLTQLSVGRKPCQGCGELEDELRGRRLEEWSVYPFEVTVQRIRLIDSALGTTARVVFDVPETRSYFEDGSFRNTSPARTGATFTVSMRQEKQAYRLVGFTIEQG